MVKEQETLLRDQHEAQLNELRRMANRQLADLERQAELLVNAWHQEQEEGAAVPHAQPSQPRPSYVPLPGSRVRLAPEAGQEVAYAAPVVPAVVPAVALPASTPGSMCLPRPAGGASLTLSQRGSGSVGTRSEADG
eukprot:symbB.v1.2.034438.t1/scaffold4445.1/size39524/3